jgi:NADPH-dependent 2,4-dienoyl-CoA reductase/sulfur reductase-like enzyme
MGAACAALHLDQGVDLRCGVTVAGFEGDGRVSGVRLGDGSVVEADVVVVGVGVVPETGWLESSRLALENGVVCDSTCATAAPGVVAAGDIARWPNNLFGETMRIEHWSNAVEQGGAAAKRLLAGPGEAVEFAPVPYFWSDQYDMKVQAYGYLRGHEELAVVEGGLAERRFLAAYRTGDRLAGVLAVGMPPRAIRPWCAAVAAGAGWREAVERAADVVEA